ncbi:MAG: hypothetical protein R2834_18640 [Rhodothermales bacterium]
MSERTYSEDEMALLLERAAELQTRQARARERSNGLTLTELEAIAGEAGLDPALLRQAAEEMDRLGPSLLGKSTSTTATHIHVEQWVDGDLTPEASEEVVDELRRRFESASMAAASGMAAGTWGGAGTVEQVGRSLEWKHVSGYGIETSIRMRPRGERVHVRLSQRVGLAGDKIEGIFYGGVLAAVAGGVGLAALDSSLWGMLLFFIVAALAIPLVTYMDRNWRKKKHRQLDELGDRIAELIVENQTGAPVVDRAGVAESGLLTIDAEEREPEAGSTARRTRSR